jgi:hypothetical protein
MNEIIIEKACVCKKEPIPCGAETEEYFCYECGGIGIGWYWKELR